MHCALLHELLVHWSWRWQLWLLPNVQMPPLQVPFVPHWLLAVHAAQALLLQRLLVQSEAALHVVVLTPRQKPPWMQANGDWHCELAEQGLLPEPRQTPLAEHV
jgi:hypothetical protein